MSTATSPAPDDDLPNADYIIRALGGCARIANACDLGVGAVHAWSHNGIPSRRALQVLELARARRIAVSLEDIVRAFPPRAPRSLLRPMPRTYARG